MDIWWLGFLIALVASLAYGYWLGGYAKRRGWTEDYARRRAALVPYCAGAVAVLVLLAVRISTGKGWSAEGSPSRHAVFWVMLGFVIGGGLTKIIVLRRIRPKAS